MNQFSNSGFGSITSLDNLAICQVLARDEFSTLKLVKTQGQRRKYYTLKVLNKLDLIQKRRVYHILKEKEILQEVRHPFIVKLHRTFNDLRCVYMLLEYLPGGELFTFVRKNSCLPNDVALFYATEILLALSYLHEHEIAYRDLKPENVLLSKHGHIKLVDFGFAKKIRTGERSNTFCGSQHYTAPEVISGIGHSKTVDWWAFGVMLYEILIGLPPFYDEDPQQLYTKILTSSLTFPKRIEDSAQNLISGLLKVDPDERLGNRGSQEVMEHIWFEGVDFDMVLRKEVDPPWVPSLKRQGDTSYYPAPDSAPQDIDPSPISNDPLAHF